MSTARRARRAALLHLRALEGAGERMRQDPVASVFLSDKLTRLPALEADLAFLLGPEWRERIAPLPTTQRYVDR
ncbi:hypothetical protein CTI14_59355, partial [Methylobacterium radiotolerans]